MPEPTHLGCFSDFMLHRPFGFRTSNIGFDFVFAVVHLSQFALQAALRHQQELWSRPIALVDPALTTPRVCNLTEPARRQGVEAGLTPTQALARCRDVSIRHRSPAQEAATTSAVLQCAYGFSPNIENTVPGTITLDLRGLSELSERQPPARHSGDAVQTSALQNWATRLRAALASLNLAARIGIGPTPNVARLAAYWGSSLVLPSPSPGEGSAEGRTKESTAQIDSIQIVTNSTAFIATLPVAALDPSTDVASILHKWGIHTVGELLALGQDAVMDRLGLEAIALFAAVSTNATRPLNLVRPAEHYEESFDFAHEVETIEPLLFILNRFVSAISQRLELGGLAAELLTLHLRLESGEVLERRLSVPQPTRRADILFRMLETHLETLRTESPILGVALKADPTQPEQKQFSLFEAALRDPHQFQETLARLSALVGADRVGTPVRENSHRADAFKLVPPDFENAPTVLRQRVAKILHQTPLRRLRPAVKAKVTLENTKLQTPSSREIPKVRDQASHFTMRSTNIVELLGPLFSNSPKAAEHRTSAKGDVAASMLDSHASILDCWADAPLSAIEAKPILIHCNVAKSQLSVALGPWRASGHWWEAGAWQRDEWDVQTREGHALRLVKSDGEWRVEAIVD
jgi:protein ImuB